MHLLIDADILCYRVAWASEMFLADLVSNGRVIATEVIVGSELPFKPTDDTEVISYYQLETEEDVKLTIDRALDNILLGCSKYVEDVSGYTLFLTDNKGNYRKKIDKDYKGNRTNMRKPVHLELIFEYVKDKYNAEVTWGQEADDGLGINQTDKTVICTTDKDLLMIPGAHYNWVKDEYQYVSEEQGRRFFYTQVLTGDPVDNIKGIPGIGKAKAKKILGDETDEIELCQRVWEAFLQYYMKENDNDLKKASQAAYKDYIKTGRLIKIREAPKELWVPPCAI